MFTLFAMLISIHYKVGHGLWCNANIYYSDKTDIPQAIDFYDFIT